MRNRRQKITLKINSFSLFIFTLLLFIMTLTLRMSVASRLTQSTVEMIDLTERKAQLENELMVLRYQDSSLSSLSTLEERAKSQGFIPVTENLLSLEIDSSTTIAAVTGR